MPKMKVIGPVPLNFDCSVTDAVVSGLLQHARLSNYYRVVYLGTALVESSAQAVDRPVRSGCMNS